MDSQLVEKLGQHLLPWMDQLSLEHLNPSLYVGLRLSSMQAGTKENLYLHSLKLDYQQCLLGYCCTLSSFSMSCFTSQETGDLGSSLGLLLLCWQTLGKFCLFWVFLLLYNGWTRSEMLTQTP